MKYFSLHILASCFLFFLIFDCPVKSAANNTCLSYEIMNAGDPINATVVSAQKNMDPYVELIYFSCRYVNGVLVLAWRTASETNNEYFIPEKSEDNINFTTVGTVKGAGKSLLVNDYIYEDRNYESNKITYYRLKYSGSEGSFSYSDIITMSNNTATVTIDPKLLDHADN